MPEYVYALHDFQPEHEDEVDFRAGERIEVVEKDDLYEDGWWQGRNLAGKVGLFPVSYTAPGPPAATTTTTTGSISTSSPPNAVAEDPNGANGSRLQTLAEESEVGTPPAPNIVSPIPKQPPAAFLNGDGYESDSGQRDDASLHLGSMPDGEVMKATMTDVQKAIEQLGRGVGREDGDGARSFSFSSTRDGGDTTETDETDFDMSDIDSGAPHEENGGDWHKNARRKLAAKARRAVAEAEKLEAMMSGNDGSSSRRAVAPPIEVELSDESEDEGDFTRASKFQREHPYILEEDETEEPAETDSVLVPTHEKETSATETQRSSTIDDHVTVPPRDESELPTATAAQHSFPVFTAPPAQQQQPTPPTVIEPQPPKEEQRPASPAKEIYPTPHPPQLATIPSSTPTMIPEDHDKRSSAPIVKEAPVTVANGLPSPSASSHFNNTINSKHNSMISSSSAPALTTPAPQALQQALSASSAKKHPTEWTLEEVIDWLKTKGFDQDVCDKFTEQEITGDVLLELDVNLLKTEIGIMAFGKRMRIANAISDLRRPPSIDFFPESHQHGSPSPMQLQHSVSLNSHSHSRTQSQSHSHHSFGATISPMQTNGYSQSVQSSLGSPMGGAPANGYPYAHNVAGAGGHFETVPESSASRPVSINPADHSIPAAVVGATTTLAGLGVGLVGIGDAKNRPPLVPSPSDGALKETAIKLKAEEEDRGHMSDGEIAPTATSMRRRLFGRSQDSTQSFNTSQRQSPLPSPSIDSSKEKETELSKKASLKEVKDKTKDKEKEKEGRDSSSLGSRHTRGKKSLDGGKHGDRLSIFGNTFSGTLGKHRKPAPSANAEEHVHHDRTSKFSLPRLAGSSIRKASSSSYRPSTPNKELGIIQDSPTSENGKSSNTLRKRTVSAPHHPASSNGSVVEKEAKEKEKDAVNGVSGPIMQGRNILEQIGEPDHTGWMRKKGDRYNSWKLRYFILKGPHLYILRNNNKDEKKIKGYVHIIGYKVTVDENVDPGRYGFRIDHDNDKTHYFSSEEKTTIREWMKAIMKATIGRDYSRPVVSSCNIPTIPLVVAQAMNPAPRPPSPTVRDATQKALRREHPDQLSSRDARVLMGLGSSDGKDERTRLDTFFEDAPSTPRDAQTVSTNPRRISAPPRPSREMRRSASQRVSTSVVDEALIVWANTHLPDNLQIVDPSGPLCTGLGLLRLAESIKGRPSSPPVPDSAFPVDANDDKLDGLFRLFDFLLDNDVKMGSVSINDVRQGKRDKILQLLRALKVWEDKRKALATTIAKGSIPASAGYMVPMVIS